MMKAHFLIFAVMMFTASGCFNDDESEDAPSTVASIIGEALEADCPSGGVVLGYGIDSNGNGSLDEDEVNGTEIICHGAPGEPGQTGPQGEEGANGAPGIDGDDGWTALIRTMVEEPGQNCAEGGLKIEAGLDTDGDGTLSDEEVTETQYICDGADGEAGEGGVAGASGDDGEPGEDGTSALISTSTEEPGANCEEGGLKIEAGLDLDANGLLSSEEATATQFICNGAGGQDGQNGVDGESPEPCSAESNNDGTITITCPDGSSVTVTDGTDGAPSIAVASVELAGVPCPEGGIHLAVGTDLNLNGMLDNDEVLSENYLCNGVTGADGSSGADGSNGLNALVALSAEAPGESCLAGGTLITTALDANNDGAIQNDEVISSITVCNGVDGLTSLMSTSAEAAGENCADGGVRVDVGLDVNSNSILDAGEITNTAYICNGASGVNGTNGTNGTDGTNGSGGSNGQDGADGTDGGPCTVVDNNDGTATMTCPDGTSVNFSVPYCGNNIVEVGEECDRDYNCKADCTVPGWLTINGNSRHFCGLKDDGLTYCIGFNQNGTLGRGTSTSGGGIPDLDVQPVQDLNDVKSLSVDWYTTCATLESGVSACWGNNQYFAFGSASGSSDEYLPYTISGDLSFDSVEVGQYHGCGVTLEGKLYCWGTNIYGILGYTGDSSFTPVQVGIDSDWAKVSVSHYNSCAIKTDGSLYCWGSNSRGQLGDGSYINNSTPTQVQPGTSWSMVDLHWENICGITAIGELYCWGDNAYGQWADDGLFDKVNLPYAVGVDSDWTKVKTNRYGTCGLRAGNRLFCWGRNSSGHLGNGTLLDVSQPEQIAIDSDWLDVAKGREATCAVGTDSKLYCWGGFGAVSWPIIPTVIPE